MYIHLEKLFLYLLKHSCGEVNPQWLFMQYELQGAD